jgi:hypothetical protein
MCFRHETDDYQVETDFLDFFSGGPEKISKLSDFGYMKESWRPEVGCFSCYRALTEASG